MRCWPAGLSVLLLSGCLTGATQPPIAEWPLSFDCVAGSHASRPGVCVTTLGAQGDTWAEPFVAIDPSNPNRVAVAVQGEAAQRPAADDGVPVDLPSLSPTQPQPCLDWGLCLFLSSDAGRTWVVRDIGGANPRLGVDAVVEHMGTTLLVAGLVLNGGLAVARTQDDGATWETALVTQAEKTDRPWLSVHGNEAVLAWQTSGAVEGFWSRSLDGGRTWSPPLDLPCNLHSKPAWTEEGWLVACSRSSETLVLRVVDGTRVDTLAKLPSATGTRHVASVEAKVLWLAQPGPRPLAFLSRDGGASWSAPFDLATAIPGGSWSRSWIPWASATPSGGLLAFVVVSTGDCVLRCDTEPPLHLVHLAPDGATTSAVQLTPGSGRPFSSAAKPAGGEFDGLDCATSCVAAWMDDGLVDVALLH